MQALDRTDIRLLELMQADASLSVAELAERVGLSASPCGRRVRALHESPIVEKQTVLLNAAAAGLPMTVMVQISIEEQTRRAMQRFETVIEKLPEIMDCYLITGSESDYLLRIVVRDIDHYRQVLLDHLTGLPGVKSIISNFVMGQPIKRTALPLDHLR